LKAKKRKNKMRGLIRFGSFGSFIHSQEPRSSKTGMMNPISESEAKRSETMKRTERMMNEPSIVSTIVQLVSLLLLLARELVAASSRAFRSCVKLPSKLGPA
jgi:activator of HSP90 ATPase